MRWNRHLCSFLHTFLQDEGLPYLADALMRGAREVHAAEIVQDLRRYINPDLYTRLVEHSFLYTPYLALFWFAEENPRQRLISLILKDWEAVLEKFKEYMRRNYPGVNFEQVLDTIKKISLK